MNHEIPRDDFESDNVSDAATGEPADPLPPLAEAAPIVDRVAEIHADTEPKKSPRQRIGSMAAKRNPQTGERPHLGEQAVIAEMARPLMRRTVNGPRTA